jgi:hypothetical protein
MLLDNSDEYQYWRDEKLANTTTELADCIVEIQNPSKLTSAEKNKVKNLCQHSNFALFQIDPTEQYENSVIDINAQFGLKDFDTHLFVKTGGLAHITQSDKKDQGEFIPYTDKNLGWHTDGYYNAIEQRIRAFSLFCVRPALKGGTSEWVDPQMIYLLLREDNPDVVKALIHPEAMSIPEHRVDGEVRRATSVGPVFFIDEKTQALYMRYTQRKKNIEFLDSLEIKQAVAYLDTLLNTTTDYHFKHLMQTGQGLLCNNVLHRRNAFTDDKDNPRLLLRGRYFNRIE